MLIARNILFAIAFYANNTFWFIFAFLGYVLPQRYFIRFCRGWAISSMWLFEKLIGAKIEIRGLENVPQCGAIVAAKHQSSWETISLLPLLEFPTYIFKKELQYVPFFGWHLIRAGQIPIERSGKPEVLARLTARAKKALGEGRQIIIFPEGTRRSVGAEPDYKIGVAQLYRSFGAPVVPVALNAGLAWPRRQFLKYPYPVILEFLEPIPAGMPPRAFFRLLQERIETATDRLVAEGRERAGMSAQSRSETQSSNES